MTQEIREALKDKTLSSYPDFCKAVSDALDHLAAKDAEIARYRDALQEIIRVDDTGPTVYEIRENGPSQALGGSKGTFANIAHAALAGGVDASPV